MLDDAVAQRMTAHLITSASRLAQADLDLTREVDLFIAAGLSRAAVAEALGWSRSTLYRRLAELEEIRGYDEDAKRTRLAADHYEDEEQQEAEARAMAQFEDFQRFESSETPG